MNCVHADVIVIDGVVVSGSSVAFDVVAFVDFVFIERETVFHSDCLDVGGCLWKLLAGMFEVVIIVNELLENRDLLEAGDIYVKDVLHLVVGLLFVLFSFSRQVLRRAAFFR